MNYLPTIKAYPVVRDEPGTLPDVCPDLRAWHLGAGNVELGRAWILYIKMRK